MSTTASGSDSCTCSKSSTRWARPWWSPPTTNGWSAASTTGSCGSRTAPSGWSARAPKRPEASTAMRWLRSDLPLANDASGRFLPWIIGCMVYLAALALAATIAADRVAQRWHNELAGTFSIQLPPDSAAPSGDRTALVSGVVDLLMNTGSVASARIVDDAEKARLLEPWLGAGGLPDGVRLPDLIVVQLTPSAPLSLK